jgi:hypothetical protein
MKNIVALLLLTVSVASYAQRSKIVQGSLAPLKGEKAIRVEFTYDNMTVSTKNKPEADYIKEKKDEYNQKEAGRGDKWEKAWTDDRNARFEPQFRELFSKYSGMTTASDNAKYTIIFHTTHTELGFNVGVAKRPAYIDGEVMIVETQNKNNVVCKITMDNAPGSQFSGYDFDSGARLQECYAKCGKTLAKMIEKNTK